MGASRKWTRALRDGAPRNLQLPSAPSRDLRTFAFRRRQAIAFDAACVAKRLNAVEPEPSANAKTGRSREGTEVSGTEKNTLIPVHRNLFPELHNVLLPRHLC